MRVYMYVCIYMHLCIMCVCMCVYIYIYIYRFICRHFPKVSDMRVYMWVVIIAFVFSACTRFANENRTLLSKRGF
jgi:hypothetical protein